MITIFDNPRNAVVRFAITVTKTNFYIWRHGPLNFPVCIRGRLVAALRGAMNHDWSRSDPYSVRL